MFLVCEGQAKLRVSVNADVPATCAVQNTVTVRIPMHFSLSFSLKRVVQVSRGIISSFFNMFKVDRYCLHRLDTYG